jgi:NADH-quinone oxidoreductase subunit A
MQTYVPVLLLMGFVIMNAVGIILLSTLITRAAQTTEKQTPYESGMPPLGNARERFSVKFYMVAMLFIIFDIETVFLIPWGVHFRRLSCLSPLTANGDCPAGQLSMFGAAEMAVFMVILAVGFIYIWKKGALQWD